MFEDLIKTNNLLTIRMRELEEELKKTNAKFQCVLEFAKGMSFNNPLQYEKLKEELKRLDGEEEE